ncbi:MAG: tyrosine-type recombinase/integrase [Eggerthellaceae bacterium]|nr:tyrosine-type recombinase/integrase [Eggerthellaceae bacterium]
MHWWWTNVESEQFPIVQSHENEQIPSVQTREPQGGALALSADAASFIERFIREADIAPTTKETYRKALKQFFRWYEARGLSNVTRADILAFKNAELTRIQASTVGAYLSALKSFFKWLEAEKLYPNVAAGVKGVKLSKGHRKDALTPAQAKSVLKALGGNTLLAKRNFALFNLLLHTGLRTVEIHRANVGDMRNKGYQSVLYVQGKGRVAKDEFVVLTEAAIRPIYDYLAERRAAGLEVVGQDSPLFASHSTRSYGSRLSLRSIREVAKGAMRAAGIDDDRLTTHSLRHSAITFALLGGASLQQAQALARHNDVNTTLIYSHSMDRIAQAPEYLIDALLKDD